MNYGRRFVTLYRRRIKTIPKKKKCKKKQTGSLGGLTNSCEKKKIKRQRRKGKSYHLNEEFQIVRRYKKCFLKDQCKEIEENSRMESLESSSIKLEIPREYFMQRWAQ